MRFKIGCPWRAAARALMVLAPVMLAAIAPALAQQRGQSERDLAGLSEYQSVIRIENTGGTPVRRSVKVGLGKSVLVEFPREVRDVMVSNPAVIDAVVLSSNRVFLLSKGSGEANAFFFDTSGAQFATIELYVERETGGLQALLNRVITGSAIKVEMLNQTVILTGSVKSPVDSTRAGDIAAQFISQQLVTSSIQSKEGVALGQTQTTQVKDSVINMLTVEAEEQVMLESLGQYRLDARRGGADQSGVVGVGLGLLEPLLHRHDAPLDGADLHDQDGEESRDGEHDHETADDGAPPQVLLGVGQHRPDHAGEHVSVHVSLPAASGRGSGR